MLRILGHPRYPNAPGTPAVVSYLLLQLVHHPRHEFWPEWPSLLDRPQVTLSALLASYQITDTYLMALAVERGAVLASLDRRLITGAVDGGKAALELIPV